MPVKQAKIYFIGDNEANAATVKNAVEIINSLGRKVEIERFSDINEAISAATDNDKNKPDIIILGHSDMDYIRRHQYVQGGNGVVEVSNANKFLESGLSKVPFFIVYNDQDQIKGNDISTELLHCKLQPQALRKMLITLASVDFDFERFQNNITSNNITSSQKSKEEVREILQESKNTPLYTPVGKKKEENVRPRTERPTRPKKPKVEKKEEKVVPAETKLEVEAEQEMVPQAERKIDHVKSTLEDIIKFAEENDLQFKDITNAQANIKVRFKDSKGQPVVSKPIKYKDLDDKCEMIGHIIERLEESKFKKAFQDKYVVDDNSVMTEKVRNVTLISSKHSILRAVEGLKSFLNDIKENQNQLDVTFRKRLAIPIIFVEIKDGEGIKSTKIEVSSTEDRRLLLNTLVRYAQPRQLKNLSDKHEISQDTERSNSRYAQLLEDKLSREFFALYRISHANVIQDPRKGNGTYLG